jgi:uncharacterized protein YxeA
MNKKIIIKVAITACVIGAGFIIYKTFKKAAPDKNNKNNNNTDVDPLTPEGLATKTLNAVGKKAYTAAADTNVRDQAYVNNGIINNIVTTLPKKGTLVGKVINTKADTMGGVNSKNKAWVWYLCELAEPIDHWYRATITTGYVREDAVILK